MRSGDFKLIEFLDDKPPELYDIAHDIGEQHDLAATMPQKVADLRERLHTWQKDAAVQMPTKNPAYDPSKPEYTPPVKSTQPAEKTPG